MDNQRSRPKSAAGMETATRSRHLSSQRSTEANGEGYYQVSLPEAQRCSVHYVPQEGIHKYRVALKSLRPIRNEKRSKEAMPIDRAGLLSTIYSLWMSKYIWKAYKTGFNIEDLPDASPYDRCAYNTQRLDLLWQNELGREGPSKASFAKVAWRFMRTRLYVSMSLLTVSLILGFISPTILMRNLLEFVQSAEGSSSEGIMWAVLLTLCEILRTTFFTWSWVLNYRTAARLKTACAGLLYRKVIRLNGLGQKSYGELVNLFAKDMQKFTDVVLFGTMIISGPIVIICGMTYVGLMFSPIALLGMITFFLFYPLQYLISRLSAYFRRKSIYVADTRVKLINEAFTSMKLIKMYAYEKLFTQRLLDIRGKEEELLRKTAYCQSLSISLSPAVPMISSMIVFLTHASLGNNLTASQAFPVATLFGPMMRMALSSLRDFTRYFTDALLSAKRLKVFSLVTVFSALIRSTFMYTQAAFYNIVEAIIALNRWKEVMVLEENSCYVSKPIVKSQAVAIVNGTFVHDVVEPQLESKKKEKKMTIVKKYRKGRREGKMSVNTHGSSETARETARETERETVESDEADEAEELRRREESRRVGSTTSIGTKRVQVLADVTFEGAKGKLVGVCGPVGSGKTSLLLAVLGQLRMTRGQLMRDGSCAYVSQEPWIVNATLKENILFGAGFDGKRYYSAITVSCLKEDLDLLPAGDQTEIGERGINLSGGQKQRVALARALYANRDIYLLDDPLSAVDAHVGTRIFENLILGALRDKAVIFVTHQVQFLKHCAYVYVLNAGRIVEHGTHEELMRLDREYALMIGHHRRDLSRRSVNERKGEPRRSSEVKAASGAAESAQGPAGSELDKVKSREAGAVMIAEERSGGGSVKPDTYIAYVLAAGGYFVAFLVFLAFFINTGSIAFSTWWLAHWIKAGGGNVTVAGSNETRLSENINDNPDFTYYRSVYASCIAGILLSSLLRGLSITFSTVKASTTLYKLVIERMISAPLKFFETTPIGRLQHIFSRDVDDVDSYLPGVLENIMQNLFVTVFAMGFITGVFPWYIVPLLLLGAIFYFVSRMFRAAIRDLKRMENITGSPLLSFVSTTVQGLSTIQAFEKKKDFVKRFDEHTDLNTLCHFMCNLTKRWLSVRLDYLAVISMSATAFLVVAFKGQVSPAFAGLALTYCAQISGIFQFTVRLISEVESRFISVERINYYIRSLRREGEEGAGSGAGSGKADGSVQPSDDWPARGHLEFDSIQLKYREDLPMVLRDVSFRAAAGEKIGIVGRTGSGKSSLLAALFRTVEISCGKITIDGIDISRVELSLLRSKLSIIPQEPVIFSGTVRTNLDPYNTHRDEEVWEVLEKTQLKERVAAMPGRLEALLEFGGTNLSLGERQLLCLSRALLRKSKVLLLDEATASIDPETEAAIQATIRSEFQDCTVLTIAHRLQTVGTSDRILVMSSGRVVEFDEPSKLLANPSSEYAKMIAAAADAITADVATSDGQ